MDQRRIVQLIEEAASPFTEWDRRQLIREELVEGMMQGLPHIHSAFRALFNLAIHHDDRVERCRGLLPLFLILCGGSDTPGRPFLDPAQINGDVLALYKPPGRRGEPVTNSAPAA